MATVGYQPHTWRDGGLVSGIGALNTIYVPVA